MNTHSVPRSSRLGNWGLLLIVSLLSDILGGLLYLSIQRIQLRAELNAIRERKILRVQSSVYHHDLRPRVSVRQFWNGIPYTVTTNSLGFRDETPREIPVSTKLKRVLLIGDSFIEGVGIEYRDTVAGRLDTVLAVRGWEVLNAAVSSYSPAIYLAKVADLLDSGKIEINHVVVFLDISDIEDEARFVSTRRNESGAIEVIDRPASTPTISEARIREFGTDSIHWDRWSTFDSYSRRALQHRLQTLSVPSVLFHTFKFFQDGQKRRSEFDERSVDAQRRYYPRSAWTFDPTLQSAYGFAGLEAAKTNLTELRTILRTRNIGMTLVVYPWPEQIRNRDLNSLQVRYWQQWANEEDVQFIDIFPEFINNTPAETMIRQAFIYPDVHWNEKGSSIVAATFVKAWNQ
jgi:lysophospholipase L1-like esterase